MSQTPLHTDALLPMRGRPGDAKVPFHFTPDAGLIDQMKADFDLLGLKKVRLEGHLAPDGQADWHMVAKLGATVTQPCVVTLAPVTTRIDQPINRRFLASPPPEPEAGETEMPEDDTIEALPETIDLAIVLAEALALALPDFPRAPDAALETSAFTEPGKAPMSDEEARPFAALKHLKSQADEADSDDS